MSKNTFKLVLVGDGQTGKTSLMRRHLGGTFDELYVPTEGQEIQTLELQTKHGPVCFDVWDFAGDAKYQGLRSMCLTGSQCAIIMFDVTSKSSCERIGDWHRELLASCGPIPIVLCGNKSDLIKGREVIKCYKEVHQWKLPYSNISVKNNYGCKQPFSWLFYKLIEERFKACALVQPHLKMIKEDTKEDLHNASIQMEVDATGLCSHPASKVMPMELDEEECPSPTGQGLMQGATNADLPIQLKVDKVLSMEIDDHIY